MIQHLLFWVYIQKNSNKDLKEVFAPMSYFIVALFTIAWYGNNPDIQMDKENVVNAFELFVRG